MGKKPVLPQYEYERVANAVEAEITSGRLPVGAKLAGEHEMSELYQASRNTVRSAIRVLRERGLVSTLPGKGSFVIRDRRPDPGHDEAPPPAAP